MKNTSVPIVGGFYADETKSWTSQDCLNWIPTQAESAGTLTPMILKTPPGLRAFPTTFSISGHLADGYVGQSGSYAYTEAGGIPPYGALTISSGSLPDGATMDAAGVVTYDYTTAGTFTWNVHGADSVGKTADNPDSNVVSNENLAHWSDVDIGINQSPGCSACTNGIAFIGCANDTGSYSKDLGVTWTVVNTHTGYAALSTIKFNGSWYCLTNYAGGASVSAGDTFVFTALANTPEVNYPSLTILGGHLYVGPHRNLDSETHIAKMGTPGSAWTDINTGFSYQDVVSMAATGSLYFFACVTGHILVTSDFVTFTESLNVAGHALNSIAYMEVGNVLIACDRSGNTWRSTDLGTTWAAYTGTGIGSVAATHTILLAGSSGSGNAVYTSFDGLTWTSRLTTTSGQTANCPSTDGTIGIVPIQVGSGAANSRTFVGVP